MRAAALNLQQQAIDFVLDVPEFRLSLIEFLGQRAGLRDQLRTLHRLGRGPDSAREAVSLGTPLLHFNQQGSPLLVDREQVVQRRLVTPGT